MIANLRLQITSFFGVQFCGKYRPASFRGVVSIVAFLNWLMIIRFCNGIRWLMVRCRKNRNILSCGIAWGIWLARNNLIFNSKQPNWDTVFDLILRRLAMLLKSSVKNFSYTGNDLDAKVHMCWWERSLVMVLKHLEKIKTICFISSKTSLDKIANSHHLFLFFISHTQ